MTSLFDNFYRYIGHRHPQWRNNVVVKPIRVATRILANAVLPLWYRLTASRYSVDPADAALKSHPRLIVSLTSFPARTGKLWLVIESLLRQTHKPDVIILWLSRDQYKDMDAIPQSLLDMRRRGLRIELRDGDIRSHKKYYYTQVEYPDDIMVTVDDDIFYHPRILESLWEQHERHPQAIITNHSHQLVFNAQGHLAPYAQWKFNSEGPSDLFFIGAGANLFPPHSLHPDVTDIESARATCPAGDDIWLNAMARLAGTPVIHSSIHGFTGLPVMSRGDVKLCDNNVLGSDGNDRQIAQLDQWFIQHYGHPAFNIWSHQIIF